MNWIPKCPTWWPSQSIIISMHICRKFRRDELKHQVKPGILNKHPLINYIHSVGKILVLWCLLWLWLWWYKNTVPLTLHRVLTILSAFASVKKTLSSAPPSLGSSFVSPKDLLVTSATVPTPSPAAKPPNDTIRAIRDDGTFLCLAVALSCKNIKDTDSLFPRREERLEVNC